VPRTGWVLKGINPCESVAEHSHRMGMLALLFAGDAKIDVMRACAMALVHDLAEALVGDIAPSQGVDEQVKIKLEKEAMATILNDLGDNEVRTRFAFCLANKHKKKMSNLTRHAMIFTRETKKMTQASRLISSLWEEYEARSSPEALLVKDLDRFEMVVQAFEYENSKDVALDDFFHSVQGKIKNPVVLSWFNALLAKRTAIYEGSVYRLDKPDSD